METSDKPKSKPRKRPLAQLLLCSGCCCGRTDRGFPALPVDRIKAVWKAEKLNRTVQLTISGCLGPCDMANVAFIASPGVYESYGGIKEDGPYDALIDWARECHAAQKILERPGLLAPLKFTPFETPAQ